MPEYERLKRQYDRWLEESSGWMKEDLKVVGELALEDFRAELIERFSIDAAFGTGGLRSKIRAGSNGINDFWIKRICKAVRRNVKRVVIAYDTRKYSDEFARVAAHTLSAGECEILLFDEPVPTPVLSFAVRYLNCDTGIVITASHNPKDYNGFKLYDLNGVQYVPREIEALQELMKDIPLLEEDPYPYRPQLIKSVGEDVFQAYFSAIFDELDSLKRTENHRDRKITVLYTPLHGTGARFLPKIMEHYGIDVRPVSKQMEPDPDFSTVSVPNPEERASFDMAMRIAREMDVIPQALIATDPDADRLGLFIEKEGAYYPLTGNELGLLLLDFILRKRGVEDYQGNLAILKTIVTTDAVKPMAQRYNLRVYETLTGFKYLGDKAIELKAKGIETLFSFEESFGYLFGTHAGDKDACSTSGLLALLLLEAGSGEGVFDRLEEIRSLYGFYLERLLTRKAESVDGMRKLRDFMHLLRRNSPVLLWEDGIKVKDYEKERGELHADVVEYLFQNGDRVFFRPSGTEPRIKAYINVHAEDKGSATKRIQWMQERVEGLFDCNMN